MHLVCKKCHEKEGSIYLLSREKLPVILMSDILYYKGLYKVKAITRSEGYWIVEALEDFDDFIDSEKVSVKAGERRILTPEELYAEKTLAPPIPEHVYERRLEKKVKRMVEEYERKNGPLET